MLKKIALFLYMLLYYLCLDVVFYRTLLARASGPYLYYEVSKAESFNNLIPGS